MRTNPIDRSHHAKGETSLACVISLGGILAALRCQRLSNCGYDRKPISLNLILFTCDFFVNKLRPDLKDRIRFIQCKTRCMSRRGYERIEELEECRRAGRIALDISLARSGQKSES